MLCHLPTLSCCFRLFWTRCHFSVVGIPGLGAGDSTGCGGDWHLDDSLFSCLVCSGRNTFVCFPCACLRSSTCRFAHLLSTITLTTILPSNEMSSQLHFISHLKAQRLSEELAVAQKKVKEYEDMCMLSSLSIATVDNLCSIPCFSHGVVSKRM